MCYWRCVHLCRVYERGRAACDRAVSCDARIRCGRSWMAGCHEMRRDRTFLLPLARQLLPGHQSLVGVRVYGGMRLLFRFTVISVRGYSKWLTWRQSWGLGLELGLPLGLELRVRMTVIKVRWRLWFRITVSVWYRGQICPRWWFPWGGVREGRGKCPTVEMCTSQMRPDSPVPCFRRQSHISVYTN